MRNCNYFIQTILMSLTVIFFSRAAVGQENIQFITFDYPPYTDAKSKSGIVESNLRKKLDEHKFVATFEYYPVARSFKVFLKNQESVFCGGLDQFPESERARLDRLINVVVKRRLLVRKENAQESIKGKSMVFLRDDQGGSQFLKKHEMSAIRIDEKLHGLEMVRKGRAHAIGCLGVECEDFLKRAPDLTPYLPVDNEYPLEVVFHKDSKVGKLLKSIASDGRLD